MPKIGSEYKTGFAKQSGKGTPNTTPAFYPQFSELNFLSNAVKTPVPERAGLADAVSKYITTEKFSTVKLGQYLDAKDCVPFLVGTFGAVSSAVQGSGYKHTITFPAGDPGTPQKWWTAKVTKGGSDHFIYSDIFFHGMDLKAGTKEATINFDGQGLFETAGSSITQTLIEKDYMMRPNLYVRLGADIATALAATPIPVLEAGVSLKREPTPNYMSNDGTTDPLIPQNISLGSREITGNYKIKFENMTEYNKYLNNTTSAVVLEFKGSLISGSTYNSIKFLMPRVYFTEQPEQFSMDKEVLLDMQFKTGLDPAAGYHLSCEVINDYAGTGY